MEFRPLQILKSGLAFICLRWFVTFYHGKSPLNPHLGNIFCLFFFQTTLSKSTVSFSSTSNLDIWTCLILLLTFLSWCFILFFFQDRLDRLQDFIGGKGCNSKDVGFLNQNPWNQCIRIFTYQLLQSDRSIYINIPYTYESYGAQVFVMNFFGFNSRILRIVMFLEHRWIVHELQPGKSIWNTGTHSNR